jgi:xylan 1,4-beta-xylosidase
MLAIGPVVLAQGTSESLQNKPAQVNTVMPPAAYQRAMTYINPILPGDHPDPTLLKVGSDFYMCGSSFHFLPNLPVLHSKDLLHWETVSRVVPAGWSQMKNEKPGGGIWQGAITYFYGIYRIYFANSAGGGQYFSQAPTPAGPWSNPVRVKGTPETGFDGYDNSVFVDDDGTPYLIIKGGQFSNRIQQIDREGNLCGKLINMDWMNANKRYSWAEGPVMCKRNGWYYYFVAGDVTGGQYVLRSKELSSDSTKWEKLGKVFKFSAGNPFPGANHMSAPFQLADGTWWCIAQSYERTNGNDWSGQGRQELLCRIDWDADGKPSGQLGANVPALKPGLPTDGTSWKLPRSDEFDSSDLKLQWHFLNKQSAQQYSLKQKSGWLTIEPGKGKSHVLQKEAGHYYTLVTRVNNKPGSTGDEGGICLTRGDDSVNVRLFKGFADGKQKVVFEMGSQIFDADFKKTAPVWLKLRRQEHLLTAYYSVDGMVWSQLGQALDARAIDRAQPNYNSWVGNSIGLYAKDQTANFEFFVYKDAYSDLPLAGFNNYYGTESSEKLGAAVVSSSTNKGGWVMLGGVDLGYGGMIPEKVELTATTATNGKLEIWIDDIDNKGSKIADISLNRDINGNPWNTVVADVAPGISGQHDLYIRVVAGTEPCVLKSIRFIAKSASR